MRQRHRRRRRTNNQLFCVFDSCRYKPVKLFISKKSLDDRRYASMFESASVACSVVNFVPIGCSSSIGKFNFGDIGVHGNANIWKQNQQTKNEYRIKLRELTLISKSMWRDACER